MIQFKPSQTPATSSVRKSAQEELLSEQETPPQTDASQFEEPKVTLRRDDGNSAAYPTAIAGGEALYLIHDTQEPPLQAKTLAAQLNLGALRPMHQEAAFARYEARFGSPRPPGIELFAFERGAIYREKGGEAWRPVPADIPKGARFESPGPYVPVEYISQAVRLEAEKAALGKSTWAHKQDLSQEALAALVSQMRSHTGPIKTDAAGLPLNPLGPTGVSGRGESNLGPILAQDLLLTTHHPDTGQTFAVLIKRKDTGRWALPGGIEDEKDKSARIPTAVREFFEETGASLAGSNLEDELLKAFENARQVYQGVCAKEPRNTDNSWFETTVFHVELPWSLMRQLQLQGGDDASHAALVELTNERVNGLHGDHPDFVKKALKME